jgi:hypothetical protein
MKFFLFFLFFSFPGPAHAYLPPAFFLYSKVTEPKAKTPPVTGVALTVARPQSSGTEEILGTISLTSWKGDSGGWPGLSLIFEGDSEQLIQSATAFGLTVLREQDLLRIEKDKAMAMKDPPHPFYKTDPNMSLKRGRQTYAWVHSHRESGKAVWVEKDTFLPLKITGPCPAAISGLGWAKSGDNKCELEFRNLYALKRGNLQSTRLTLWKDGAPVLFFNFEKVTSGKMALPKSDERLAPEVKEIAEAILH